MARPMVGRSNFRFKRVLHTYLPCNYKRRKCGVIHPPPTGKHCRELDTEHTDDGREQPNEVMSMLRDSKRQFGEMRLEIHKRAEPSTSSPLNSVQGYQSDNDPVAQSPDEAI